MTEHTQDRSARQVGPTADPQQLIHDAPMSRPQLYAVAVTSVLSALDGFDLLSTSFVAPVLARTFHANSAVLGILLAAGLLGALIGSVALAPLADVLGRRPIVLTSLTIMVGGMLVSAVCTSLVALAIVRVITGLGAGTMVVVINPIAVEVTNRRLRSSSVAMMSMGYPLGAALGGVVAAFLLAHFDWRAVFLFGAAISLAAVPLVVWHLPESLSYLLDRRRPTSLARVNAVLHRFGHGPLAALPAAEVRQRTVYREILRRGPRATTVLVCLVSLLMFLTNYFFLSWQPSILVKLGFGVSGAAAISGASSLAGAVSCVLFALVARRIDGRALAVVAILGLGVLVIAFGLVPAAHPTLVVVAVLTGFCDTAAVVGLYATAANVFGPTVRATGTGLMIGVGRIGSVLAPATAGSLFALGGSRANVSIVMGMCAILAGVVLLIPLLRGRLRTD